MAPQPSRAETPGAASSTLSTIQLPQMPRVAVLEADGSNYTIWRNYLLLSLRSIEYSIVDVNDKKLTREDYWVGTYVISCCTAAVQSSHLIGIESPRAMIEALDEAFKPQGKKRAYLAWMKLSNISWDTRQSVTDFVAEFRQAEREALEANLGLSSDALVCLLLERARPKYPVWVDIQVSQWTDSAPLSVDTLCKALVSLPTESTIATMGMGALPGRHSVKCSYCKKRGHTKKNCWTRHPEQAPKGWSDSDSDSDSDSQSKAPRDQERASRASRTSRASRNPQQVGEVISATAIVEELMV